MVDFKKVDELREKEAEVRKGLLAKIRSVDPAIYVGVIVGIIAFAIILVVTLNKG